MIHSNYYSIPRLALTLAGTLAPLSLQGAILYQEDFASSGSTVGGEGWSGWGALGDVDTATNYTTTIGTAPNARMQRTTGNGSLKALFAQGRGGTGTPTVVNDRFVAVANSIGSYSLVADELSTIRWDQGLNYVGANPQFTQVLVQVGGNWYASVGTYTNSVASSNGSMTNIETKELDLTGASGLGTTAWHTITFGDGEAITLGAQVDTPIGTTLTSIGFAIFTGDISGRTVWIDNVQLNSIPEPSALLSSSVAGLLLLRRRRG